MTTFDRIDPITVLQFFQDCWNNAIMNGYQRCKLVFWFQIFVVGKALHYFLVSNNASSYAAQVYWPQYVNYYLSIYPTKTTIRRKSGSSETRDDYQVKPKSRLARWYTQ